MKTFKNNNFISPILAKISKINKFAALDIETIKTVNGEVPVAVSLVLCEHELEEIFFVIDKKRLKFSNGELDLDSLNEEVIKMWRKVFKTFNDKANNGYESIKYVYVHNLGSFDGYFIFKYLTMFFIENDIKTIIDNENKFISITFTLPTVKFDVKFIDSYRIFPVSLQNLCQIFNVDGKFMDYDVKFHDVNVFYDKNLFVTFKKYSLQDALSLFNALINAQNEYFDKYNVDITTIVSASSLALKIFRVNFLKINIPIPDFREDSFVRDSYFGGATDIYRASGKKLHYLDVNSLYPHAMLNKMPIKLKGYIKNMKDVKLENFFAPGPSLGPG